MAISLTKLSSQIEKTIDAEAKRLSNMTQSGHVEGSGRLKGMQTLAGELGVKCDCFFTEWVAKPRTVCRCEVKKKPRKKRKR